MDVDGCCCFSPNPSPLRQFDESIDIVDTSGKGNFIKKALPDSSKKGGDFTGIATKRPTRGESTRLPLWKLVCVVTDGASAMVGNKNWLF
jgi:hypothetical protein